MQVFDALPHLCRVTEVIDGDTVRLETSVWETQLFEVLTRFVLRLAGINAPELHDPAGPAAKSFLIALLGGRAVTLRLAARDTEKYGRCFGSLALPDGGDVAAALVKAGQAAVWDGKGPRPKKGQV